MPISANFQASQIQELKIPLNTNFRGTQTTQKQNKSDTVEIQGIKKTNKKKGLSNYKETVRMRKVGQQNEKFAICVQLSRKFFNFV